AYGCMRLSANGVSVSLHQTLIQGIATPAREPGRLLFGGASCSVEEGSEMTPGNFCVCVVRPKPASDGLLLDTVQFGFDTAAQAFSALRKLQEEYPDEDLAVIQLHEQNTAEVRG